jgi:RecB family exonuclease|tara:strand:- start:811 stop:1704 length:894 start_codon:yes stop_codon:yes gene_type:complete
LAKKIPKIVKEIINNPPHEIDYSYQKNISYSQISMFKQCPHKWKLHYKDKINQRDTSIYLVFGIAIHEVIQEYLKVFYNVSKVKANELDLETIFQEKFIESYQKQYKDNNNEHFSSAIEMREFYEDGVEILRFFKKKIGRYFSKRGTYLVGVELPIINAPNKMLNNILFMGMIDIILYNENSDTFDIIDIKTSTRGWHDKMKKNEDKQFQLILYKKYFSELYNIPLDKIDIKFFIVKRKLYENVDWTQTRIQEFSPPSGKIKMGRATRYVNDFMSQVFDSQGKIKEQNYPCTCGYCE